MQNTHPKLSLIAHFKDLPDPRVERTKDHDLIDLLVIAICTLLCAGESFNDMEDFGKAKADWFRTFLTLRNGIPSHDTFNRLFAALDPQAFLDCFLRWTQSLRQAVAQEIVALDGKALRRALNGDQRVKYVVSAWAEDNGLVLGQLKVADKSNEITALPELLRVLELLVRPGGRPENERHDASVVPLALRRRAVFAFNVLSGPTAIAAGVALVVGFVFAFVILTEMRPPEAAQIIAQAGVVEPGTTLYEVLQSRASTEAHALDDQTTALPRMSFVTTTGNYCRQIEVTGERGTTHAVACRRNGDWRLELASFDATTPLRTGGLYRPATNETPAPIEATINALIDGEPLGSNAEQEAIAGGWAPKSAP
jgi:hypothetical protein